MSKIRRGKSPEINLEPEVNQPQSGFKVTLQKPSKIKSNLDIHVVGQDERPVLVYEMIIIYM